MLTMHKQTEPLTISSLDNVHLYGVLPQGLKHVWKQVLPLLEETLLYSDNKYGVDDIHKAINERDMQLWVVCKPSGIIAYVITQIVTYPKSKRLVILFCGGKNMNDWLHLIDKIHKFAKAHDCTSLEIYGRPGWEKALADSGYEKIHTVLRCDI